MMKILNKPLLFFTVAAAVIYFTACEKHTYVIEPPEIISGISYSQDIQPIFDSKCVRCHAGSTSPDLRQVNSYSALSNGGYLSLPAEESGLYKAIVDNMHSSFTNQDEKNKIYSWLADGAKEETEEEIEDN